MNKFPISTIRAGVILTALLLPALASAQELPQYEGDGIQVRSVRMSALNKPEATQMDLQKAKDTLTASLDQLEVHFQATRQKAAALQKLTQNTGADIVQTIDGYLAQIETLKTDASNAKTGAELKAVANEVHGLILDAKFEVKKNIGTRVENHIDQFTQKTEQADAMFDIAQNRIKKLKSQGKDTEVLDKDLEDCRALMIQGKQNLLDAKSKFIEVKTLQRSQREQGVQLMNEGIKNVQNARATYGRARENCPRVMKELRVIK